LFLSEAICFQKCKYLTPVQHNGKMAKTNWDDQLVMDTKTSFMPDARKMTSSNSSCGAILCLDVEVASDGTYSQFSQIGAVLSAGGQTSYFEAKVGKGQNGEVLRKGCLLLVKT
jgi:hypothetical protein